MDGEGAALATAEHGIGAVSARLAEAVLRDERAALERSVAAGS